MPERFEDKVSRKWKELRMNALKSIFKWAIEQYDKLHNGAFLAFSWGIDEVTDYHVIAERSYMDHHVYGTKVTWYETEPPTGCEDCKYWDGERCANSNGKDCHNSILWWPKDGE